MKHFLKLLIPIGFGIAAAFLNQLALKQSSEPISYVVAVTELEIGHVLESADLEVIQAPRDLRVPAVLAEDLQVLIGMPLQRPLEKGDLLLRRDITMGEAVLELKQNERAITVSLEELNFEPALLRVGRPVGFIIEAPYEMPRANPDNGDELRNAFSNEVLVTGSSDRLMEIGPFRVLSVGSRTSQFAWNTENDNSRIENEKEITVAVSLDATSTLDDNARKLIEANRNQRVFSLMFYPERFPQSTDSTTNSTD